MKKIAGLYATCTVCTVLAACALAGEGHAASALTWGDVVARSAEGCDAFTPVLASDGHHYTAYGDCSGLNGRLPGKVSMGFGRIIGGPSKPTFQDLPTRDLTDYGDSHRGQKPSSALVAGDRLYMWVRNYGPGGTQARLKYSDNFTLSAESQWTWAPWTLRPRFGTVA